LTVFVLAARAAVGATTTIVGATVGVAAGAHAVSTMVAIIIMTMKNANFFIGTSPL
jgi:hypothetical protein